MKLKHLVLALVALTFALGANAQTFRVRWHNESADTTRLTELLKTAAQRQFKNPSERVGWFGRQFIGTPYVAHTLEGDEEILTVSLDELDCTTFVELAMALAFTTGEQRQSWRDFVYNLRRLRYRGGEVDGYASRLHYICDWAIDNAHRGNFTDVTRETLKSAELIRTIDFMSANRDKYPSLADSLQFARMLNVENGYRNHKFPYIKTNDLSSKEVQRFLRDGDVIAFVSKLKNLDVTHMGIVVKEADGIPYVLHASSTNGKVEISNVPLQQFVKRNPGWIGIRIFRLKE